VNRSILYATSILVGVVSDRSLVQALRQHQQSLRRRVTLTPITVETVDSIQLDRLSEHYEDILRLARLVIGNSFIGEIEAGSSASFAMLVNMNTVFENAVERAFRAVIEEREGWRVEPQEKTRSLLTGGKHQVTLKPDVTVYDENDRVRLIVDAKWKTDSPSNSDFYQMTSYMLAHDVPGLLVYPDCNGANATEAEVADQYPLTLTELSTATDCSSAEEFVRHLETEVRSSLSAIT
jgi:5-methylcytosine-specific restriction enzyme subunit McrC